MAFQVSPGVHVSEIDLTTSIPAVSVSTGALAGTFNWGPVLLPTSVSSEIQLAATFGTPDQNTATSFFSAANFLSYASDLRVVRSLLAGANTASNSGAALVIENPETYFTNQYATSSTTTSFAARCVGTLGNSVQVLVWPDAAAWTANTTDPMDPLYPFATNFDYAPGTSPYIQNATGRDNINDEIHVLVIDVNGAITGYANTVLERYQAVSVIGDALASDGSSNYYKEILYRNSKYLYWVGHPTSNLHSTFAWGSQTSAFTSNTALVCGSSGVTYNTTLTNGADGVFEDANTITALDTLANPDFIDISLILTGNSSQTVQQHAINIAESRADCVAFVSPPYANTTDPAGPATSIAGYTNVLSKFSSYAVMDSGWKYQYDKYNDVYRWVPLNGDIAGLCARTDNVRDPWYSPAGLQRGSINNIVKLAFNPDKTSRDTLYKAGVNPVVSFPGEGTILYGDKTLLNRPSAFDRINVRRLFIVLEKAISRAARSSLFEFNDDFTRAQFVALVEPFLRTVKGRRGVYDFKVVCDKTNNTPDIIDANQFVGDIYIQPARSINFIQLNFVAVRTGVSFTEVVGKF
jgi:hypothetical protein